MSEATRILVVDDDPKIRAVIRRGLAYEGYRVIEAATGEEGLEKAREHLPELVVLDVMLPGIDGLEVTRRLRSAGDEVAILTGLGLAIAHWIVESHAGTIELAGREGEGTVATVALPIRSS